MTPAEKNLIISSLRELSDRQSNDGCNDFELANTPENVALCKAAFSHMTGEQWDGPPKDEAKFWAPGGNWMMVSYLADKLAQDEDTPDPKTRWVPAGTLDGRAANIVTVEGVRGPSWESSLVYGTLARMDKDGMDTDPVYAVTKETKEIDLRILINGHEYPATAFVERWRTEFDYQVAKEARELLAANPKVNETLEKLREELNCIEQGLYDMACEAFPNADLDREE